MKENVGDCLSVEREEVLNKRPDKRASFSVQLGLVAAANEFGLRQTRQSVVDRKTHQ